MTKVIIQSNNLLSIFMKLPYTFFNLSVGWTKTEICDIAKQGDTILYGKLKIKKKIFFSLIVVVLFLLAVELLSYAVLSFVCLPMPGSMLRDNFSYLTSDPDLGWVPVRGALAHIVKYPQGYDVTIRTGNGFRKDSQDIRSVKDCDVITIGVIDEPGVIMEVKYDNFLPEHIKGLLMNTIQPQSAIGKYTIGRKLMKMNDWEDN